MKNITLNSGYSIPILGLGTWKSAPGEVYTAVKEALKMGYRHIDCAPIYGNEKEVGQAITESITEGVVKREELFITTKLWNDKHAPSDLLPALKQSLADLQLEYLDLYLIHWAVAHQPGVVFPEKGSDLVPLSDFPLTATWEAMEKAVDEGLVRSIGVSNFGPKNLGQLLDKARIKPAMNQVELHPYLQQNDLLAFCKEHDIALTAYSPLGSKDRPEMLKSADEPILLDNPVIGEIAKQKNCSPAQILLAWAIARETVVIPKSVNPERMKQNLAAADLQLTQEEMAQLKELDLNRRYVDGSLWAMPGSPYSIAQVFE